MEIIPIKPKLIPGAHGIPVSPQQTSLMVSFVLQIVTEAAYDGRNPQARGSYLHQTFNLVRKLTRIEKMRQTNVTL